MLEYSNVTELKSKLTKMSDAALNARLDTLLDVNNFTTGWEVSVKVFLDCLRQADDGVSIESNADDLHQGLIEDLSIGIQYKRGYMEAYELLKDITSRGVYINPTTTVKGEVLSGFFNETIKSSMKLRVINKTFAPYIDHGPSYLVCYDEGVDNLVRELSKGLGNKTFTGTGFISDLTLSDGGSKDTLLDSVHISGDTALLKKRGWVRAYVTSGYVDAYESYINTAKKYTIDDVLEFNKPEKSLSDKLKDKFAYHIWQRTVTRHETIDETEHATEGCKEAYKLSLELLIRYENTDTIFSLSDYSRDINLMYKDKLDNTVLGKPSPHFIQGINHGTSVIKQYLESITT